jgi:tetratricopeptide (TPR) repeat protein
MWYTCCTVRNLVSRTGWTFLVLLSWLTLMAQDARDIQHRVAALEQQVQKYLQDQKPELAIPVLREIASLDPKKLNARANLGVLLYFQGSYPEAIPHLRAALQMQPDLWRIEALHVAGGIGLVAADLERAFANLDDRKFQIQAGLELVELYSASAQLGKALSVAAKLEELAPQNPQILGIAEKRTGDPKAALNHAAPTPGTFGNMGRNIVYGPKLSAINMSLIKTFSLTERIKLEFSGNATNVLNHPSFALPDKSIGPGHIGKITGTSVGARQMELIAKLRF